MYGIATSCVPVPTELRDTAMVAVQKRSLPISTSSLVEVRNGDGLWHASPMLLYMVLSQIPAVHGCCVRLSMAVEHGCVLDVHTKPHFDAFIE